jgi:hypothetical protein
VHAFSAHLPAWQAKSTSFGLGQSASLVQGLATQWPPEHVSSAVQSLGLWHARMHCPVMPPALHWHPVRAPQTIGFGGAEPSKSWQSESVLQGCSGRLQMPQPIETPPGLQLSADWQSLLLLHTTAPSVGPPASVGHGIALCRTDQEPFEQVAIVAQP